MCELCERDGAAVEHGMVCLSCGDLYCADPSEPNFAAAQCIACRADVPGECYSRNARIAADAS